MATGNGTDATKSASANNDSQTGEKDNTMAMLIMAGIVVSSAGFTMYTKQADSLLRRMNSANKIQGIAKSSAKVQKQSRLIAKPERKNEAKNYHGKDDSFL